MYKITPKAAIVIPTIFSSQFNWLWHFLWHPQTFAISACFPKCGFNTDDLIRKKKKSQPSSSSDFFRKKTKQGTLIWWGLCFAEWKKKCAKVVINSSIMPSTQSFSKPEHMQTGGGGQIYQT